ncbi:hypothetical protein BC332_15773 [Capsicum chinense]|nr:hypothetical protein BC332_15773 [Capsicum chinense]
MQRLGVYKLEGLVSRLASLGSPIYKALRCKKPTSIELFSTCTCFMKSARSSCSDVEIKHLNVHPREPLTVNFALVLHHMHDESHLALDQGSHSLKTSMRYQVDPFLTSMGSCDGCQDEDFSAPIKAQVGFLGSLFPLRSRPGWPASGSGNSLVPWSMTWLDVGSTPQRAGQCWNIMLDDLHFHMVIEVKQEKTSLQSEQQCEEEMNSILLELDLDGDITTILPGWGAHVTRDGRLINLSQDCGLHVVEKSTLFL